MFFSGSSGSLSEDGNFVLIWTSNDCNCRRVTELGERWSSDSIFNSNLKFSKYSTARCSASFIPLNIMSIWVYRFMNISISSKRFIIKLARLRSLWSNRLTHFTRSIFCNLHPRDIEQRHLFFQYMDNGLLVFRKVIYATPDVLDVALRESAEKEWKHRSDPPDQGSTRPRP